MLICISFEYKYECDVVFKLYGAEEQGHRVIIKNMKPSLISTEAEKVVA